MFFKKYSANQQINMLTRFNAYKYAIMKKIPHCSVD